jgi:hypothetical protein
MTGAAGTPGAAAHSPRSLGLSPNGLQAVLIVAGISCCVAMSMPQVHIVAYCVDLGYGVARGAEMLSLMLGLGIVSRIASGFDRRPDRRRGDADDRLGHAGGRAGALRLFRLGLTSLYVVSRRCSACSRAASCRATRSSCASTFPAKRGRARVGVAMLMATLVGMALRRLAVGRDVTIGPDPTPPPS